MSHYLGIDTSAYTTSLAIIDKNYDLVWEERKVLDVPTGERGLAQSAALFQHIQNLPVLIGKVPRDLWDHLLAIGVSLTPRPIVGSYMPVFTGGYAIAETLSKALRIPLLKTSHQEGHIAAGMYSAVRFKEKEFLAIHISGGTTELLKVKQIEQGKLEIEILGGTTDLHAGQFIDRIGVYLGLPFPSGKYLEELAIEGNPEASSWLPSSVKGLEVSFSGVETAARCLVDQNKPKSDVARAVEGCIVRTMVKLIKAGIEATNITNILIVGGVASNHYLRSELERRLLNDAILYWAQKEWSRDNAIGVAMLTGQKFDACLS